MKTRTLWTTLLAAILVAPALADVEKQDIDTVVKDEQEIQHRVTVADKYEGIEITVNINTASADELATLLKGVGKKKAQDIVVYREKHGEFTSADDLIKVKGIGPSTIEKNRERIEL